MSQKSVCLSKEVNVLSRRSCQYGISFLVCFFFLLSSSAVAQTTSAMSGSTPSGLQPGAPAGSYSLSGFENVNLYNGNLNFNLPLLKIGGRGGAQMSMAASLDSVKWKVETAEFSSSGMENVSCGTEDNPCYRPPYEGSPAQIFGGEQFAGVTLWEGLHVGYGPGVLQGRYTSNSSGSGPVVNAIIRLTFTSPDGTEYELRDLKTNGRPQGFGGYGWTPPADNGWTYVSADGTMTFTSDAQIPYTYGRGSGVITQISGYLMLADGTRYRIENGLVMWIRDRNGNQLSFSYYGGSNTSAEEKKVHTITDSLGRAITVNYADTSIPYDRITFPAFGGTATQEIRVYRTTLGQALRHTQADDSTTAQNFGYLFPELVQQGSYGLIEFNPPDVISQIQLPDGRSYSLYYNIYNELARVELPTGGAIEYDYTARGASVISGGSSWQFMRRVTKRRVYAEKTSSQYENLQTYTPTYTPIASYTGPGNATNPSNWETMIEVKQYTSGEVLLNSEKHTFFWSPVASLFKPPSAYSGWKEGKERKTEWFDANGNPSRRVENVWQQCEQCELDMSWWAPKAYETQDNAPPNNPHISETVTTLLDATPNQVSKQTFKYDKYNNLTDSYDYDYNPGTAAAAYPVRHTKTDYLTTNNSIDYTGVNVHIRNLPTMQRVYVVNPQSGTEPSIPIAQAETIYDESAYLFNDYGTVTQWLAPATTARGNATTIKKWYDPSASNGYLDSHVKYDQCGSVRETWAMRKKVPAPEYSISQITYWSYNNSYAFPIKTTTPVPDLNNGAYGSTSAFETSSVYDFSTGLVTSATDANNKITTIEYLDPLNRPTKITRPSGGGWTSYEYGDTNSDEPDPDSRYVRTRMALDASHVSESYQYYDGMGRTTRSLTKIGSNWSAVDTQYDNLGRVWKVSNPYSPASLGSNINTSALWTITSYDSQSRVLTVTTPDNAQVKSEYSGALTLVTDQKGRKRLSQTNALGQLTNIWEITSADGATETVSFPGNTGLAGYRTSYTYDLLGNLRKVEQGAQHRYFVYDALSRLLYARNPEQGLIPNLTYTTDALTDNNNQWSLAYTYDPSGNLASRTDARGVTTGYAYDALNRNTTVSYSDGTPGITRRYDGATLGKGKLWQSETGSDAGTRVTVDSYDALGRPLVQRQQFKTGGMLGQSYAVQRSYNLAGQATSQTYPSGHTISYGFDDTGRLLSFEGNLGDGVQRSYATGISYDEAGRMQQEQYGTMTPLYHKLKYNVRGQLYDVRLSTKSLADGATDWDRGCLAFYYSAQNPNWGGSASDNNGNLIKAENYVPQADGGYYEAQDNYSYDALNRLTQVSESPYLNGAAQTTGFTQAYSYDRYGNRTINQASSSLTINHQQFAVDSNTNRMGVPAGIAQTMSYDAAGNLTFDSYTGMGSRTYDAENRMTTAADNSSQTSSYTYDADGRRVRRKTTTGGEVWQVYGMEGELLAEYAANNASFIPTKEYGYRSGQLLVTAANGDEQRLTRFVNQLYRGALGRDATTTELQTNINSLGAAGAQSEAQLLIQARLLAQGLFEPAQRTRTDREYVQDLYWAYFGRAAEIGSLDYWTARLAQPTNAPDYINRAGVRGVCENWGEFTTIVAATWGANTTGENERSEHFLWNVYLGAQGYMPSAAQMQPQSDALNTASAQGEEAVISKAKEIARAQIEATAYTARNRTDSEYVTDLYEAFWQRSPDGSELSRWMSKVTSQGRASVLTSFADSTAFREVAGTLYRETLWLIPDQLGTPRMIAERTGSLAGIKRHDYLPFGEEIFANTGGRTSAQGYVSDSLRQQFTSYERDDETGVDYAQARYYSSQLGRFSSTDPLLASGRSAMPQSWNRYAYVLNNPLLLTDPTGLSDQGGNGIKETFHPIPTSTAELTIGTRQLPYDPENDTRKILMEDEDGNDTSKTVTLFRYEITYTVTNPDGTVRSDVQTKTSYYVEGETKTKQDAYFDPPTYSIDSEGTDIRDEQFSVQVNVGGAVTDVDYTIHIDHNVVEVPQDYNSTVKGPSWWFASPVTPSKPAKQP